MYVLVRRHQKVCFAHAVKRDGVFVRFGVEVGVRLAAFRVDAVHDVDLAVERAAHRVQHLQRVVLLRA